MNRPTFFIHFFMILFLLLSSGCATKRPKRNFTSVPDHTLASSKPCEQKMRQMTEDYLNTTCKGMCPKGGQKCLRDCFKDVMEQTQDSINEMETSCKK